MGVGVETLDTARAAVCLPLKAGLAEVLLLAGQVRPTPLTAAIHRSLLDLPIGAGSSLLAHWQRHLDDLKRDLGLSECNVRVLVDQSTPLPKQMDDGPLTVSIERDPRPLRGTGGLLRDVAATLNPDSYVLVAHGPQLLIRPLPAIVRQLAEARADVAILSLANDRPCGLMLVRCGVLATVAGVGFVDLREQALPQIAKKYSVKIVPVEHEALAPTRTREDYLRALRLQAALGQGLDVAALDDPFAESWQTSFAVVEDGATVHPSAHIHDSVILAGAAWGAMPSWHTPWSGPAGWCRPERRWCMRCLVPAAPLWSGVSRACRSHD